MYFVMHIVVYIVMYNDDCLVGDNVRYAVLNRVIYRVIQIERCLGVHVGLQVVMYIVRCFVVCIVVYRASYTVFTVLVRLLVIL